MKRQCEKTQKLLERYFDGELSTRFTNRVEDHLVDCSNCEKELAALQRVRGVIRSSFEERASELDFSQLWQKIEPQLEGTKPSVWERFGVAAREYFSVYKHIWAPAAAALAIAALVAVPLLARQADSVSTGKQNNECIIESIESSGSTAMVYEIDKEQTKVIWMFEDPEEPGDGPSSL